MSLRLEMLQVARLAPQQLGEARDLVAAFLHAGFTPDGGCRNRAGDTDLYYTVFGLDGLIALQEALPVERVAAYLERFGEGADLDLVHLCALARCWAAVSPTLDRVPTDRLLQRLEAHRSDDGGYAQTVNGRHGGVYAAFLAMGMYGDLRTPLIDGDRLRESVAGLRARDGGYANRPDMAHGLTSATAAAVLLLRHLDSPPDPHIGMWLLDRCHPSGGFLASPVAPMPDLLSTATALHALSALHAPLAGVREPCLDFLDSLWTNRGGFHGHWADEAADCEYTYYGLLSLGHLSLAASATPS